MDVEDGIECVREKFPKEYLVCLNFAKHKNVNKQKPDKKKF